ncbi:potassium channel subfamily K member 1-like [Latimeria chalumnae]|uniref:potassium channel subfamily K member 1-like n=1 Tax=Latimeria chalumnae TaxID=7897 RepID=UPI0006D93C06|nr:PREDICTED: potassium channel subfamily K member 1-like [Latimeria chalumnae]|eukprot:XP_014340546.1 PREDICTED: potassium channel subfamily K member 1-like [Latimeria chalumnae]
MRRFGLLVSALFAVYALYLALGAVLFSVLELPYEAELRERLQRVRAAFLNANRCLSAEELEEFLQEALAAERFGVSPLRNVTGPSQWDFTSSLLFTVTTLTTTGYGHPVPLSDSGKAFCLVYSSIGIPFTMCFLTVTAKNLLILFTKKPIQHCHYHYGYPRKAVKWIHSGILIAGLTALFFFIPAWIFSVLEVNWGYFDALYFCFISLSTVGFGDYVPGEHFGQQRSSLYKLSIVVYLLVGLAAMLLLMETLQNLLKFTKLPTVCLARNGEQDEDQSHVCILNTACPFLLITQCDRYTERLVNHHSCDSNQ